MIPGTPNPMQKSGYEVDLPEQEETPAIRGIRQVLNNIQDGDPRLERELGADNIAWMRERVAHVRAATQDREHCCHWPGCYEEVPPAKWGCTPHWFMLPKPLRNRIWAAYVPGQEQTMTPSDAYLQVAREVQQWIDQQWRNYYDE